MILGLDQYYGRTFTKGFDFDFRKDLPPHLLFQGDILEEKKDGTLILQVRRVVYSRDSKPPREPAPAWPQPKIIGSKLRLFGCDEEGSPRFITTHKDYVLEHDQRVDANSALNQIIHAHILHYLPAMPKLVLTSRK